MKIGPCLLVLFLISFRDGHPGTEAERSVPRFTDLTLEAGIDFHHYNGARGGYHLLEIMSSGAALLDFDGDGYLDLFVVGGSRIPPGDAEESRARLYRNRRDGTFRDATRASSLQIRTYGMGAAAGDYDNDGDPDLYVTGYPRSQLFQNQGNGRFRDVSREAGVENSGHWGSSAGFFDYDRDGLLDLFVCNYVAYDPGEETPCHTAGRRNYCHPTTFETDASVLYRNQGNGRFQDRSESSGIGRARGKALGVAFTDLEPDGYPDVFVANDTVADFLFRNNRDGTFQEVGFDQGVALDENGHPRAGMGVDFGDYDGDGRMDLIVTNFADEGNALFRRAGTYFNEVTYQSGILEKSYVKVGFGARFFDYDNDGDLDAFVANGHIDPTINQLRDYVFFRQENLLYENRGGRFRECSREAGAWSQVRDLSRGAAFGDLDNDGDVDIVVTNNGGPVNLLRNDTVNRNNWLLLRLEGVESNRDALGARLRVQVAGQQLHREVQRAASYLSSHDPRVHLGLGGSDLAELVEIHWPSGILQSLRNVKANQILTVREKAVP